MTLDKLIYLLQAHRKASKTGGDTPISVKLIDRQLPVHDCYLDLNTQAVVLVPEGHEEVAAAEPCPGCGGDGQWQVACCSGARGCSCAGDVVDMGTCNVCKGTCNVCKGTGYVIEGQYDREANIKAIEGCMYIGSGPTR